MDEVERKLERLRALYESFFAGVERRAPHVARTDLNRAMLELQQHNIRNSALRFRHQSLAQRWTLLTTYWNRTMREIESGCYRRDLERAYRRLAGRGAPMTEGEAAQLGIPVNRVRAFVDQQNRRLRVPGQTGPPAEREVRRDRDPSLAPPGAGSGPSPDLAVSPVPAVSPVSPPSATASGGSDASDDAPALLRLHAAYVAAHAALGRPGPPPTLGHLSELVMRQLGQVRGQRPNARVALSVAVQKGKIVIKAAISSHSKDETGAMPSGR